MIQIIENFCLDPDGARASALESGFGTWAPNQGEVGSSNYTGMSFWGKHSILIHALAGHLGKPVFPNSMFFRVTNKDTEKAYVHSDRESGSYTCICYLSKHSEKYGTGFYRHRESGLTRMPSFAELSETPDFFAKLKKEMVEGSEKDWELVDYVSGDYNKAVIFDAPLFHARIPKDGFSDNMEEGRMVWASHFCLLNNSGGLQ